MLCGLITFLVVNKNNNSNINSNDFVEANLKGITIDVCQVYSKPSTSSKLIVTYNKNNPVEITKQNDSFYQIKVNNDYGYVLKSKVAINTTDSSTDKVTVIIKENSKEVKIVEKEVTTKNTTTKQSTIEKPSVLYTNIASEKDIESKYLQEINSFRTKNGLKNFENDEDLKDKSDYYCSLFVKDNQFYQISDHKYNYAGKTSNINNIIEYLYSKDGNYFVKSELNKIGITVIKNKDSYYYCILMK